MFRFFFVLLIFDRSNINTSLHRNQRKWSWTKNRHPLSNIPRKTTQEQTWTFKYQKATVFSLTPPLFLQPPLGNVYCFQKRCVIKQKPSLGSDPSGDIYFNILNIIWHKARREVVTVYPTHRYSHYGISVLTIDTITTRTHPSPFNLTYTPIPHIHRKSTKRLMK